MRSTRKISARIPALRIVVEGGPSSATVNIERRWGVHSVIGGARLAPIGVDPRASRRRCDEEQRCIGGRSMSPKTADRPRDAGARAGVGARGAVAAGSARGEGVRLGGGRVAFLLGVALASRGWAAVVGAVTGVMSLSSANTAKQGCVNDQCPPPTWGDIDSARTTATVSTVAFHRGWRRCGARGHELFRRRSRRAGREGRRGGASGARDGVGSARGAWRSRGRFSYARGRSRRAEARPSPQAMRERLVERSGTRGDAVPRETGLVPGVRDSSLSATNLGLQVL